MAYLLYSKSLEVRNSEYSLSTLKPLGILKLKEAKPWMGRVKRKRNDDNKKIRCLGQKMKIY